MWGVYALLIIVACLLGYLIRDFLLAIVFLLILVIAWTLGLLGKSLQNLSDFVASSIEI